MLLVLWVLQKMSEMQSSSTTNIKIYGERLADPHISSYKSLMPVLGWWNKG
jgi:hypothetical protein